jgi:hypothetical protein
MIWIIKQGKRFRNRKKFAYNNLTQRLFVCRSITETNKVHIIKDTACGFGADPEQILLTKLVTKNGKLILGFLVPPYYHHPYWMKTKKG